MTNISNWIEKGQIVSQSDAISGERVNVFAINPDEDFEASILCPIPEDRLDMYSWPKYLADFINGRANVHLKAGERSENGELNTLGSSYRNFIWVPAEDSELKVFTTCPYLDNWISNQNISSAGDLPSGTTVKIIIDSASGRKKYEELTLNINSQNNTMYDWPSRIAKKINQESNFLKAGEKNKETSLISPLGSSYRNIIWTPANSDLLVKLEYNYPEEFLRDIESTYSKVKNANLSSPIPSSSDVAHWYSLFNNGKFSDITYPDKNQKVTNSTPLYSHLSRTKSIASYLVKSSVQDANYINMAFSALNFYASQKYNISSWWDRQVGLAKDAAISAMLICKMIPKNNLSDVFLPYIIETTNTTMGETGANQADFATIQLFWSLAGWENTQEDKYIQYMLASLSAMNELCYIVDRTGVEHGEGISSDYSISQHNPKNGTVYCSQLYTCSYGTVLLSNIFSFIKNLSGSLNLAEDAISNLIDELTEGLGWHTYAGMIDIHPQGRAISRGTMSQSGWASWTDILMPYCSSAKQPALLELKKRLQTKDEHNNNIFIGARAFWVNDYLVNFSDKFCFWNKAISTRTAGSETGNGENTKGYYIGNGSYWVTSKGNEYYNIQPVWDWERIPGTTVELHAYPGYPTWPKMEWGSGSWGSHDFVGAISDGTTGVLAMTLSKVHISGARKTNIVSSSQVNCLATCIDTSKTSNTVLTSVAQDLFCGQAVITYFDSTQQVVSDNENITSKTILSVSHNGLTYDFSEYPGQNITVKTANQTGRWSDINTSGSTTPITQNIFSVWINHGKSTSESYGYRIYAHDEMNIDDILTSRSENHHLISSNDKKLLAGTIYQIDPGTKFSLYGGITLEPLSATSFVAKADDSELKITSTDISQKGKQIEFNVSWQKNFSMVTQRVCFPVQTGNEAGRSTTLTIKFQ
jgi:chondroitin AC lyase